MTRNPLLLALPRVVGPLFVLPALWLLAGGCSSDDPLPVCDACSGWSEITTELGRFPAPHPLDPAYVAFSTIVKDPTAEDARRESDEDLWLSWIRDEDRTDPSRNISYQLTFDDLGNGNNFFPRWSPSGTQLSWVHADESGQFEIWRMSIELPTAPDVPPVLGIPERVVEDARDPAWINEESLLFTRDDNLYQIELPGGTGRGAEFKLTYNPPSYTASDPYVDRHPDVAPDEAIIFNTMNRRSVSDLYVEAYEVDNSVDPRDTTAVAVADGKGAWIQFQAPEATIASYPIFDPPDTLRTPALLKSIPVDAAGGWYRVGTRIDSRLLSDDDTTFAGILRETYCDTTLTRPVFLEPNGLDTLRTYFELARGNLEVTSGVPRTTFEWRRADDRITSHDFPDSALISNADDSIVYECLLTHQVTPGADGVPIPNTTESILVTAQSEILGVTQSASIEVTDLTPGMTRVVKLFPTGSIRGHVTFDDTPPRRPEVRVDVYSSGTGFVTPLASAQTGAQSNFAVSGLVEGLYDLRLASRFYLPDSIAGVAIVADGDSVLDNDLMDIELNVRPTGVVAGTIAYSDSAAGGPFPRVSVEVIDAVTGLVEGSAIVDPAISSNFAVRRLLGGSYNIEFDAGLGYAQVTAGAVVTPPDTTFLGTVVMPALAPGPVARRMAGFDVPTRRAPIDFASQEDRSAFGWPVRKAPTVLRTRQATDAPVANGTSLSSLLRAPGDESTLWRVTLRDGESPVLTEIYGSPSVMQSPAITANLGAGGADVRYIAYVTDEGGVWELRVQKFTDWSSDGAAYYVQPPGTTDNLTCRRSIFHPRWAPDTRAGDLRLFVALSDCPDNGFEDLGFDDQPWATGEVRIWEVLISGY